MVKTSLVSEYWRAYCATKADENLADAPYLVDQFGDDPALWEWQAEGSDLPQVGTKTVVLNGTGQPICIVETTEVQIQPFHQVDAQFAYDEGEDDRTLESWRREHWKYFSRVLPTIGKQPTEDMPLVCERFKVVYPLNHSA